MSKTLPNTRARKSDRAASRAMLALAAVFVLCLTVASNSYARRAIMSSLVQDMDFGEFVGSASTGTIILSPLGLATYNGVFAIGGAVLVAEFDVQGERLDTFLITLPSQIVIPGANGDMIIDSFTSDPPNSAVFNGQGKATVTVGATMHMTNQMTSGLYSSSFDIIFTYAVP